MAGREPGRHGGRGLTVPAPAVPAGCAAAGALLLALPGGDGWETATGALVGGFAGWLAAVDAATHRLPNRVLLPAAAAVLLALVAGALLAGDPARLVGGLVGAGAIAVVLLVLAAASGGGLGFGDVKFGAVLGLWTGALGPVASAVALFAAFLSGGLAALAALALRRAEPRTRLPFGPFLALGAAAATWWSGLSP